MVVIFQPILDYIEQNLHNKITAPEIARLIGMSPVHMHRLFTFAYGMSVAEYVRKRKLTESLSDLLQGKKSVLEIALSYGFEYEQSFTRAFKAEFGMTPGQYRKNKPVVAITPPIYHLGNSCGHGLLFGPEIVLFPKIYLIGIQQKIPYRNSGKLAPKVALNFWDKSRMEMEHGNEKTIFYGLTHHLGNGYNYSYYLTAVEAGKADIVPAGMTEDVFGGYPCVKFHYIGRHPYWELSQTTAKKMYNVIENYFQNSQYPQIHLEKIDLVECLGETCLLEWFAPVLINSS